MGIGILGGTFDPIHQGHLDVANHVMQVLQLKRILFIPCFRPPHREAPLASPADRLAMVKLALQSYPNFMVEEMEINRKGLSYSVDTLTELRKRCPHETFYFILGWDVFLQFHLWHHWEKIPEWVHLIVVNRSTTTHALHPQIQDLLQAKQTHALSDLKKSLSGKIYFLEIPLINISATQIRESIQSGEKNISGLDPAVERYIFERGLYQY